MRTDPDETHRHMVTFRGTGAVYVDTATNRFLTIAGKWGMLIGIPFGFLCATLVANNPWIGFVAGYSGGGIVGWGGGMIYASLTKEKHRAQEVESRTELKQNFGYW